MHVENNHMTNSMDVRFLGIGNPLLDLQVGVDSAEILEKYELKEDDAILADEKHMPIYRELLDNYDVKHIAGGAGLNTLKMIQWISNERHSCHYFGCIGKDSYGTSVKESCDSLYLRTHFIEDDNSETGKCAVIVRRNNRSMVTHLGACTSFKVNNITDDMWKVVDSARIVYIAGYFVNSSLESILKVADIVSKSEQKLFTFNLSAPFLANFFCDKVDQVIPYVDILFGNASEACAYGEKHNLGTDLDKAVEFLYNFERCRGRKKKRIVLITDGNHPITLMYEGKISKIPVIKIDPSEIVDSNGAGDALVAGFLHAYSCGKSVEEAVAEGNKAAIYILKQSGFTLSDRSGYN